MENLANIVGKNLSTLRKAKGLTQQELAREINYSDKSISKWELGYSLPGVDVLKDFASFYGVTIDYLVSEQTAEELEKAAHSEEGLNEARAKKINQGLTLALTVTFVFLVAICVYFSGYYNPFRVRPEGDPAPKGLWIIFVWMVPVSIFLCLLETWRFYHSRLVNVILSSCFMWTFLISFCVQYQYFNDPGENIWFILAVGIPIQVILILWGNFKRKKKLKN